jgi:UDP-N-acetylglucosamine 2-epimerase (non-hydrolysing)/GDP/UDP-N,N'-diacetylbacillosamine 2-epimerase (hydrolysing)
MKKRKILFITERRADYSRLKPIMKAVQKSPRLELQLVVTGMHLLKKYGETKKNILQDGFRIDKLVPIFSEKDHDDGASMVRGMGKALVAFADIFPKLKPDVIFSGFDIGANFAAAITGMHINTVVSHIQGGEVSGTVDEVIRHGMTKFAHIHFAATERSKNRIIKLGENPKYVFNVGSPSLDTIHNISYSSKESLAKKYNFDYKKPLIIILQHPVTTEVDKVESQIKETIDAVKEMNQKHDTEALAVYSNNDAGGGRIVKYIEKSGINSFPHIDYEDFLRLMNIASVLVGNSSAGIHEAPSLKLPTVNIGTREQFREKGVNTIDVDYDKKEIMNAIERCLFDKKFINKVHNGKNPYDAGNTAEKVVRILETIELPPIQKVITY